MRRGWPSDGLLLTWAEVLFEELDRILGEKQVGVREQIADVEVAGQDDLGAAQVLKRAADHVVRRGQDDQRRVVKADRVHELFGLPGLRLVEDEALDDPDLPVHGLLAQRGAKREASHLPGHALAEVARSWPEHRGATLHRRFADG